MQTQPSKTTTKRPAHRGRGKSRASSVPWKLVGVLLVAAEVTAHRDSWLFALAMVHNVVVKAAALSERASEAAFALSSMISNLD